MRTFTPWKQAIYMIFAGAVFSACGELPEDRIRIEKLPPQAAASRHSTQGCELDDDCEQGMHCFQSLCVTGCSTDADCTLDGVCTDRGRCVFESEAVELAEDPSTESIAFDQSQESVVPDALPATLITGIDRDQVFIPPTGDEVFVTLSFNEPLPPEGLAYTLAFHDQEGRTPMGVVYGDLSVEIPIPLAGVSPAQGKAAPVDIVTAAGRVTVYLMQPMRTDGYYAGHTKLSTFGGAKLPVEFLIETAPSNVSDLRDAQSAHILVSTASSRLLSLPISAADHVWARAPLTWDEATQSWVAVLSEPIDNRRVFGDVLYPEARRSLRIELTTSDDEVGIFRGAWTDRWHEVSDRITQDGIVQPVSFAVSGSLYLARAGDRPDVSAQSVDPFPPPWQELPAPAFSYCKNEDITGIPSSFGEEVGACAMLGTLDAFEGASPALVSECAMDYAAVYGTSSKLADQLYAFLDPARDNPYDMSFAQFLDACAAKRDGICVSSRQTYCGRELAAYAYRLADAASGDASALADSYNSFTQDIFLGAKLAAFHSDTTARLAWLQSSEAPLFLAGPLKDYNLQLLSDWQARVLDTLIDAVFGQLDDAGLAFLSRASNDGAIIAMRQTMLLDLGVLWQSAADSLAIYAKRLNLLEENDTKRQARAKLLQQQYFRLYVAAAILAEFGREVGANAQNVSIGNYMSALEQDIAALSMPFNKLVLARANEVVTAQSLDPSSNSRSLMRERYEDAMRAVESAKQSVELVHEEARLNDFTVEKLRERYEDQILSLRNELINLCGLPHGCEAEDVGTNPECRIQAESAACGLSDFATPEGVLKPRETSVSDAGIALHELWGAIEAVNIAEEKQNAALTRMTLRVQAVDDFVQSIAKRQDLRRTAHQEINTLVRDIRNLRSGLLTQQLQRIEQQQALREQAFAQQEAAMQNWSKIIADGVESDMKLINRANTAAKNAEILTYTGERINAAAEVAATIVPEIDANPIQMLINVGKAIAKTAIKAVGFAGSTAIGAAAVNQRIQANSLEAELSAGDLEDDQFTTFVPDTQQLGALRSKTDIAAVQADIDAANLKTDVEIQAARALIDAMQRALEIDEANDRDIMELRDRRDTLLKERTALAGYGYQLAQTELTVHHHLLAYEAVVQRAKVLQARFENAQNRWANIENILGSPDVIFSFSNRLALAESRLDSARTALQEWLIALEYYAVRPFVAQRMAILLARNPQQLEAIAHELERLQSACGGAVTRERVDVSLRDNLLGLRLPTLLEEGLDGAADRIATPPQRFRALLQRANTPVNKQARLNAKQTIGQRLAQGDVWAANFTLSVDDFANLPQTCNAKVDSIAVQLVGLERMDTQPVVTIVYDGSSEMRSCQANIRELVLAVGPEATSFGPVTRFKTGARAISPVAGFADFGSAKTWNATLEGTPLAAGYTLLIDRNLPANKDVPWEELQDIRLQFAYSYQDVFPDGQCE